MLNSLDYAKTHANIDDQEVDMIMAYRKSALFNDGKTWTKKNKNFDVTMGAQDGAEVAELTGIYLLKISSHFLEIKLMQGYTEMMASYISKMLTAR